MKKQYSENDLKKLGYLFNGKEWVKAKVQVITKAERTAIVHDLSGGYNTLDRIAEKMMGKLLISFPVDPIGKPRMTSSDKWKKRPATDRYWELKARLKLIAEGASFAMPESGFHIISYLPMPDGWSKAKKEEMEGQPHRQKPDIDNICKGVFDSLCKDDSYIFDCRMSKYWAYKGRIDIYKIAQ